MENEVTKEKEIWIVIYTSIKMGPTWIHANKRGQPPKRVKLPYSSAISVIGHKKGAFCDPADAEGDVPDLVNKVVDEEPGTEHETLVSTLCNVDGVNMNIAEKLIDKGFKSVENLAEADLDKLTEIKGIGEKLAETIQNSAVDILEDTE